MVERFHADSHVRATELLLQERVPRQAAAAPPRPVEMTRAPWTPPSIPLRRFRTPHTVHPHAQFLSNGSWVTVVTNAGGGSSSWRDLSITRAREDRTMDVGGQCLYLRDVRSGLVWSPTWFPTMREPEDCFVTFAADKAVFRRTDDGIESMLEVMVSAGDDTEVRRLSLTNRSDRVREIDVTSYAEIVLGRPSDDLAHPAFGKLFVQTEYLAESATLICGRRPRAADEPRAWAFHVLSLDGHTSSQTEWETSRVQVPRPRPHHGVAHRARRPLADRHDRRRARPGGQPAPARPPRARRLRPHGLLDGCRRHARDGRHARAALSRSRRRHARRRHGLHAQPDAAASPRDLERSGAPVRSPGLARALPRRLVARRAGAARRQHARAVRPLGARHLGRPADPARLGAGRRRPAAGAQRAAGPGVLAAQGPSRRRRHPQRAPRRLPGPDARSAVQP